MFGGAVVGSIAVQMVQQYHFTKGFFGTNGISRTTGFTTPDSNEAAVKQKALEHCLTKYVLEDSSKFNQVSAVPFADFSDAEILTDTVPEGCGEDDNVTAVMETTAEEDAPEQLS